MNNKQLPPLPDPHIGLPWRHNAPDGSIHSSAFTAEQMREYALQAIQQTAQQAEVTDAEIDALCLSLTGFMTRKERDRAVARAAIAHATQPAEVTDEQIAACVKRASTYGLPFVGLLNPGGTPSDFSKRFTAEILALRPVQVNALAGCNCRWDGDNQVEWCELHLAHKEAIHEWAERAKSAEQKLALRPVQVPMTDERSVSVKVDRELFSFHSEQDWVNKARSRYANCGVQKGHYITVDAAGHVMHMGLCFKHAAYPVTVYQLQTNWPKEQA